MLRPRLLVCLLAMLAVLGAGVAARWWSDARGSQPSDGSYLVVSDVRGNLLLLQLRTSDPFLRIFDEIVAHSGVPFPLLERWNAETPPKLEVRSVRRTEPSAPPLSPVSPW